MALNLTGGADDAALVNGRFEIHPGQPLPELDCGPVTAFAASELRETSRRAYALLTDSRYSLRWDYVSAARRIDNNHMLRTIEWDVVVWPNDGRRHAVLVLDQPAGARLMAAPGSTFAPFAEEPLTRRVILPLTQVLNDLAFHSIAHRNIRVGNLFYDGSDPALAPIMLGEFLSTPPAFLQPAIYEPIEFAMSDAAGRGEESQQADLYAFGVTLIALLTGREPLAGLSDQEVVQSKLAKGSYAALMGEQRVSLTLMEILRGLLNDDPMERWTLEDLEMWVGGRRMSPRQQIMPAKGIRPLEVAGRQLSTAREVADALSRNWDAALAVVQDGTLDQWLRRSLSREDTIEAVNDAKTTGGASEFDIDDATMARVCIALDPIGPIRLRGLRAMLPGIGGLLAANYDDDALREHFTTLVRENIPLYWSERMGSPKAENLRVLGALERVRTVVDRSGMGQGFERALYELSETVPCRSPLLESEFVVSLDQLLPALERIAANNPGALGAIIDPHIAAFVAARLKSTINAQLHDLQNDIEPFLSSLAAVRILNIIQDSTRTGPVPALCVVAAKMLEPGAERYHSRAHRKDVLERMHKASATGKLDELLAVIDDPTDLNNDEMLYQRAVGDYVAAVVGQQRLDYEREHRTELARHLGGQISTLVAGVAAAISILVVILVKLF